MQVAGLFNGGRSEGVQVHTSMLEVSFTQHSLQVIQDRARCGVVHSAHIAYRLSTAATVCDAARQCKSIEAVAIIPLSPWQPLCILVGNTCHEV